LQGLPLPLPDRIALLLGRSLVPVHNRGESESINRRSKLAWVEAEAEGGTSMDPAVAAAEGNGAGGAAREGPVGASTEGIARET
jgi:hypothetical protein